MREMSFLSFLKAPFFFFSLFLFLQTEKKLFALLLFSISSSEARRHAIQSACDEVKPTIEGSCNQGDKRKPSCALGFRFLASVIWRKKAEKTRKMTHKLTFHCNSSMCTEKEKHTCTYQFKLPSRTFIFRFVKKQKNTLYCAAKLSSIIGSVAFSTPTHAYDRQSTASF